jgi:hypothetical protein
MKTCHWRKDFVLAGEVAPRPADHNLKSSRYLLRNSLPDHRVAGSNPAPATKLPNLNLTPSLAFAGLSCVWQALEKAVAITVAATGLENQRGDSPGPEQRNQSTPTRTA